MAKLRHIAVMANDPERMAAFYTSALEMTEVSRKRTSGGLAIYLSDGVMNLAIFQLDPAAGEQANSGRTGLNHIGFVVDDLKSTMARAREAGGTCVMEPPENPGAQQTYEVKFVDPEGVAFDISRHPWPTAG